MGWVMWIFPSIAGIIALVLFIALLRARAEDPFRNICKRCDATEAEPCRDYTGRARIECPRRHRRWS